MFDRLAGALVSLYCSPLSRGLFIAIGIYQVFLLLLFFLFLLFLLSDETPSGDSLRFVHFFDTYGFIFALCINRLSMSITSASLSFSTSDLKFASRSTGSPDSMLWQAMFVRSADSSNILLDQNV